MNSLFTVSQIARAIGCSRQHVHQQLACVPADGDQLVNGQISRAWRLDSIPPQLLQRLAAKAQVRRFSSIAALLNDPGTRYESPVPFNEIAPAARNRGLKLQRALSSFLPLRNTAEAQTSEFCRRGVAEYRRVFEYPITERHWRSLFDRTIERDAGREEWARPELYVDENPPRMSSTLPIAAARERGLSVIEDALASLVTGEKLTVNQKDYLWTKVCDELQLQIGASAHEKKTKRAIVRTLVMSGLVGSDPASIRRNLNRQWAAYCANDGKLRDHRQDRDSRAKLPESDARKLIARALDCGGRERQAFRELRDNAELSAETLARTIANPSRKSYIPRSITRQITPEVERLMPLHRGNREFELRGPYVPQDHSKIAAGEAMQLDDVTLPVYYWENTPDDPSGIFFGRGQWILAIDVRSRIVLGHALHSSNVYNMRIVRGLLLRVHDKFGLPEMLILERGMWKSAKILKGDEVDITTTEQGLREFGIRFQHRTKPRGKIIERVIGLLQNQMERLTGYVGRDERNDRFERVQEQIEAVRAGREHPSKCFFSKSELLQQLDAIIQRYNHETQQGELRASPFDVWNKCLLPQGTVQLGEKARFLLAHHKKPVKVQPRGIRLPAGLGGGLYYNEITGRFAGQRMLAWINPDELDAIALTSVDLRDGPYIVDRAERLSPIDATDAELSAATAQIAAHNSYARTQYRVIQDELVRTKFRPLHIDRTTVELSTRFDSTTEKARKERQKKASTIRFAQSRVRRARVNILVDSRNAERAAAAARLAEEALQE